MTILAKPLAEFYKAEFGFTTRIKIYCTLGCKILINSIQVDTNPQAQAKLREYEALGNSALQTISYIHPGIEEKINANIEQKKLPDSPEERFKEIMLAVDEINRELTLEDVIAFIDHMYDIFFLKATPNSALSKSGLIKFQNFAELSIFFERNKDLSKSIPNLNFKKNFEDTISCSMQTLTRYLIIIDELLKIANKQRREETDAASMLSFEHIQKLTDVRDELKVLVGAANLCVDDHHKFSDLSTMKKKEHFPKYYETYKENLPNSTAENSSRNSSTFAIVIAHDLLIRPVTGIIRIVDFFLNSPLLDDITQKLSLSIPTFINKETLQNFKNQVINIYFNKPAGALNSIEELSRKFIKDYCSHMPGFQDALEYIFNPDSKNRAVSAKQKCELLTNLNQDELSAKTYLSSHILQQVDKFFDDYELAQNKKNSLQLTRPQALDFSEIRKTLTEIFKYNSYEKIEDEIQGHYGEHSAHKTIVDLIFVIIRRHIEKGGVFTTFNKDGYKTLEKICTFLDDISQNHYVTTVAEPMLIRLFKTLPTDDNISKSSPNKARNSTIKRNSSQHRRTISLEQKPDILMSLNDNEQAPNIFLTDQEKLDKKNSERSENDKKLILFNLIEFLEKHYKTSNNIEGMNWDIKASKIARLIENIYLALASDMPSIINQTEAEIIKAFKADLATSTSNTKASNDSTRLALDVEFKKALTISEESFETVQEFVNDEKHSKLIDKMGNDGSQHIVMYHLLKIYNYYNATEAGVRQFGINPKNKWHKEMSQLLQEALLIYNSDCSCFASQRILMLIDETAARIDAHHTWFHNSRLANTLMILSHNIKNGSKQPHIHKNLLPKEVIDPLNLNFSSDVAKEYVANSKFSKVNHTIFIANILSITNYYLDNHLGRLTAKEKGLEFNRKKVQWQYHAQSLRLKTLAMSKKGGSQSEYNALIAALDETVTIIREDSCCFGAGSRLAETLAFLSVEYGGSVKLNNASLVMKKILLNDPNKQATLNDLNAATLQVNEQPNLAAAADKIIANNKSLKTPLNNDELLILIANIVRISAYYQNLPIGQSILAQIDMDHHIIIEPNKRNNKWLIQAEQLALDAIRTYETNPALAKEYLLSKLENIVLDIRSHCFFGKNSRLANTLEKLINGEQIKSAENLLPDKLFLVHRHAKSEQAKNIIYKYCIQKAILIVKSYIDDVVPSRLKASGEKKHEKAIQIRNILGDTLINIENDTLKDFNTLDAEIKAAGGIGKFIENLVKESISTTGAVNAVYKEGEFGKMIGRLQNFLNSISTAEDEQPCIKLLSPGHSMR